MSLLDEARSMKDNLPRQCVLQRAIDSHPKLEAEIIELISADKALVPDAIAERVLSSRGITVSATTVARHRKGNCRWCAEMNRSFK